MKRDDHGLAGSDALAVHLHVIPGRNPSAHIDARAAVHIHPTGFDEFVTSTARADCAGCEVFVEADAVVGSHEDQCKRRETRWAPRDLRKIFVRRGLALVLGLWKTHWGLAGFPLAALLEKLDALEALEDGAFAADGGIGLKAIVL
jgi:hypothetical protein